MYTIFSPSFYAEAVRKDVKKGIGVFFLFSLLVTIVTFAIFTVTFGVKLLNLPDTLSDFPKVSIEDGTLSMEPAQPYEFIDGGQYIGIDPTGEITEIPEGYNSGVLLTRDSMIIRSEEAYGDQAIPYDDLLKEFDIETFYLDHEMIANWVQTFGVIIIVISPVFIFIGEVLSRFFAILFISVIGFIVMSAMEQEECFKKSFLIALYASIPVTYLNVLQGLIGKGSAAIGIEFSIGSLCCLIPLFFSLLKWGIFWGIGAYGVNKADELKKRTPEVEDNGIRVLEEKSEENEEN